MTARAPKSVLARITGRVQGVGYRDWTRRIARRHGLVGWVRNRADGSVEAAFHGEAVAVEIMLAACRSGPPLAVVEAIRIDPADPFDGTGFEVRPTV